MYVYIYIYTNHTCTYDLYSSAPASAGYRQNVRCKARMPLLKQGGNRSLIYGYMNHIMIYVRIL